MEYESGPALSVIARILFPIQGFFNFIIFIHPKVTNERGKKSNAGISWCMIFMKAVQSRGPRQKRLHIISPRKKLREGLGRFVGKVGERARNKKTKCSPEINEEEKHEIVPSLPTSDFTTHQGSSMYASNISYDPVSRGDVESGSLRQQQYSSVNAEENREVAASQAHSSHATHHTGLNDSSLGDATDYINTIVNS